MLGVLDERGRELLLTPQCNDEEDVKEDEDETFDQNWYQHFPFFCWSAFSWRLSLCQSLLAAWGEPSSSPQLYFLFSKFDLISVGGGVSIKSYFHVGLSLNVDNFFLGIFTICCYSRHRGVSVDALFTIFATDRWQQQCLQGHPCHRLEERVNEEHVHRWIAFVTGSVALVLMMLFSIWLVDQDMQ